MKLSFEKVNKILLGVTIAALIFRKGNFFNSYIPKPFELGFVFVCVSTLVYLLTHNKIKTFFLSISKHIWIAVVCLVASILLGWGIASSFMRIPTTLNTVLEFGTFFIGLCIFILVLFYTRNDHRFSKYYLYALIVPGIYSVFILIPTFVPQNLLAIDGNFVGLTGNVNIVSKTLLLPALFFVTYTLFPLKNRWYQILFACLSIMTIGLLFWIASRGALVGLAAGLLFTWILFSINNFTWKKTIFSGVIILVIVLLGFLLTPYSRKQVVLTRILYSDAVQFSQVEIKEKPLGSIVKESIVKKTTKEKGTITVTNSEHVDSKPVVIETRFQIWPYYIKNYILRNPFGIGPNTHIESKITNTNGEYVSTGPHNTYLQLLLWGGIIALGGFLYLLWSAFINLRHQLKQNFLPNILIVATALFALLVTILFDDSLSLYSLWVILGLALNKWPHH